MDKRLYIDSLDGIRAVAVMTVFVSHAGYSDIVPGGFGVTMFFFLSGYLITTLMRLEHQSTGRLSLKLFYLRRVYRIFPPLYVMLLIGLLLAWMGIEKHDMQIPAVTAQFIHLTNYYAVLLDNEHFVPHTSVLWSLAVEEHYYLMFPLLFLILSKRLSYHGIAMVLGVLCVLILMWRLHLVYGLGVGWPYTYKATDARLDSIMYGCIMGLWANPVLDRERLTSDLKRWAALILASGILLFCLLYRDPGFRETYRYSLQGIALFPIFYLAVTKSDWLIFRWLNWPLVKGLGVISYVFYLSHITGLALATRLIGDHIVLRNITGLGISVAFSTFM